MAGMFDARELRGLTTLYFPTNEGENTPWSEVTLVGL
jgi:hypothetical protein